MEKIFSSFGNLLLLPWSTAAAGLIDHHGSPQFAELLDLLA